MTGWIDRWLCRAIFPALAALSILCVMPAARAQAPTDAEVASVRNLLGFTPEITREVVRAGIAQQPEFARYDDAERECLLDGLQPEVDGKLQEAFASLFEDSATIDAWLRFGETSGGGKFMEMLRGTLNAKIHGIEGMAPSPLSAIARMNETERAEVRAFLESQPASVLEKGFPDIAQPVAFGNEAARRCGIEVWDAVK